MNNEEKEIVYVKCEPLSYQIGNMNIYKLYDALCYELCFESMITLYKLIKNKIETLEDEPRNYCMEEDKNMERVGN